jgi:hypothetical protein
MIISDSPDVANAGNLRQMEMKSICLGGLEPCEKFLFYLKGGPFSIPHMVLIAQKR